MTENDTTTLDGFLAQYAADTGRVVLDLDMHEEYQKELSPFIIVRNGPDGDVVVLNAMLFPDHLCIDVHTFVDGKRARTGVFGMENGRRFTFDEDKAPGTSHKWPATALVALLVGEQA